MMTPIGEKNTRVTQVTKGILNCQKMGQRVSHNHGYLAHCIMSGKKLKVTINQTQKKMRVSCNHHSKNFLIIKRSRNMREFWKIWKYALGSFNDETTKKYDNWICIIRTLVMMQLIITNCFIIAGNIRHWNDLEKDNKISVHFLQQCDLNRLSCSYRNELHHDKII